MGPLQRWSSVREMDISPLCDADCDALVEATRRCRGPEAAALVAFWAVRQPGAFLMVRDEDGCPRGYVFTLVLSEADTRDPEVLCGDPRLNPLLSWIDDHASLREGEQLSVHSWLDYRAPGETRELLAPVSVAFFRVCLSRPGVAWSFVVAATQQQTATLLGVPFPTFRRHLTIGVGRIIDWLWDREVAGYRDSE